MQRALVGIVAALALIGSQAVAGSNTAVMQAGDRAGSASSTSNEFMGMPLSLTLLAILIIGGFIAVVANEDDGPSSP